MKTRIQRASTLTSGLLFAGIGITILATFLLIGLDYLVHTDLYRYGLQFNYEWAGQYWTYFRLALVFLGVAVATTCIAVISSVIRFRSGETERVRLVSSLLLFAAIVMTGVSAVFLIQLDYLVHTDLYRYGLQFNYEWAGQYWTYFRLILGLQSAAIATEGIPIALFLSGKGISERQHLLSTRFPHTVDAKSVRALLGFFLETKAAPWYLTIIIVVFTTALTVFTIPESGHPLGYVRYSLGAIFVFWLPGYSLLRAVFPAQPQFTVVSRSLDFAERMVLSIGMSLALVPIVGLLLNYSPGGISTTPIVLSLLSLTLVFATAAFVRENQIGTRKAMEKAIR